MRMKWTILGFLFILFGLWVILYEPTIQGKFKIIPDADPVGIGGVGFIVLGIFVIYLEIMNKGMQEETKLDRKKPKH